MAAAKRSKLRQSALKAGYRSGLEQDNAKHLEGYNVDYEYEKFKIKFTAKPRTYTPDFRLSNGIIIETKGRFISSDRSKHLLVKAQHPELDIRFVFSNSNTRLSKTSTQTYGGWCERHGFLYTNGLIPVEWMKER
tara:strand:- start:235 stop:639 length:405 start_codon:yes stop_codon:yes gene_type:complete